jgi:hypothetical protein
MIPGVVLLDIRMIWFIEVFLHGIAVPMSLAELIQYLDLLAMKVPLQLSPCQGI